MKEIYTVLEFLAEENRTVLTPWRIHLLLRRKVDPFYPEEKVYRLIRKLEREELITLLAGNRRRGVFQVTSPYAPREINPLEVIGEAYYSAVFCYATTLELNRLSDQRSREIHIYLPKSSHGQTIKIKKRDEDQSFNLSTIIPPGSSPSEWRLTPLPAYVELPKSKGYTLKIHSIKTEWMFGFEIAESRDVLVRRTDTERALIDGLRFPKYCGGLSEVFRSWVRALESIEVDKLIDYTERFNQLILYQRIGFVMETLGLHHEALETWKEEKTTRGGSRVLNPEQGYASAYSEDWQISINHPVGILETKDASYS